MCMSLFLHIRWTTESKQQYQDTNINVAKMWSKSLMWMVYKPIYLFLVLSFDFDQAEQNEFSFNSLNVIKLKL